MHETRTLAEYACSLRHEDIPAPVIAKAKTLILDQLGLMLGLSILPWSRIIHDYVRDWGPTRPEATVAHHGLRIRTELAAFANSCFGHGFEMDDLYFAGSSHPGCIVIPAALAIAERDGLCGRDLLTAVVAGYEIMGRINAAITPSAALRGFHSATSITGPFGAAVATAKLRGLDVAQTLNALAIAGSHAAGVTEYDQSGGSVKRMHAGMATQGGMRAALLAERGLTGPATILEGKHGVLQAYTDKYRIEEVTAGLGSDFRVVLGTATKAYCACGGIHAAIDALQAIRRDCDVQASEIATIRMGTNHRTIHHVSADPVDITGAQFSAAYSLALTWIKGGNGFADYSEANLRDPAIHDLASRVTLEVDPEIDRDYPRTRAARVTLQTRAGRTHSMRIDHCKGTAENPLDEAELLAKFRGVAGAVADPARLQAIIDWVGRLERQPDLKPLAMLLASPATG